MQIAVAVDDLFAGNGGDAVAGDDDAGEIGGVGGGYGDGCGALAVASGAEGVDSLGEGELLAAEAGDEAAAADLAAGFETAEDAEKVVPSGGVGLAGEEVAEEDAVAGEEYAGGGLECGIGAAGLLDCGGGGVDLFAEERPAAGGAAGGAPAGSVMGGGVAGGGAVGAGVVGAVRGGLRPAVATPTGAL